MPNNITNSVTFGTDAAALAAFQTMLRDMQLDGQPLGSIDFNKLIPMPQELDIESGTRTERGLKLVQDYRNALDGLERLKPSLSTAGYEAERRQCEDRYEKKRMADPKTWALGEKAYQNIQKYGHPTWYEWCVDHWGTKWNAYGYAPLDSRSDTMVFFTAWDSVPKLLKALSRKYPDQEITYRWADEDIGYNVGEITLKGGEEIGSIIPADGSREAYEMSAEITGMDLADCNLFLTADKSTYEYRNEEVTPPMAPERKKKSKGKDQAR